jgi:hypothetical protein
MKTKEITVRGDGAHTRTKTKLGTEKAVTTTLTAKTVILKLLGGLEIAVSKAKLTPRLAKKIITPLSMALEEIQDTMDCGPMGWCSYQIGNVNYCEWMCQDNCLGMTGAIWDPNGCHIITSPSPSDKGARSELKMGKGLGR